MSRWLPATTDRTCPTCGRELTRVAHVQEPLLRGAGYGAATRTVVDICDGCWTVRLVALETLRPTRREWEEYLGLTSSGGIGKDRHDHHHHESSPL